MTYEARRDVKVIRRWGRIFEAFGWTSLITMFALAIAGLCPWLAVAGISIVYALFWRVMSRIHGEAAAFFASRFRLACDVIHQIQNGASVVGCSREWRTLDDQLCQRFSGRDGDRGDHGLLG